MAQIRIATPKDAAAIRAIYAPYIEATSITFHTEVPSGKEFAEQIRATLIEYPWYVAELDGGEVAGYAYAAQHHPRPAYRWSVNASIYLAKDHHQRGIGRKLYAQLFETVKRQGFRMIHGGITMPNEPSVRLHESFDFKYVGTFPTAGFKLGSWKDVGWWVLDLMPGLDENQEVPEPVAFSKLR